MMTINTDKLGLKMNDLDYIKGKLEQLKSTINEITEMLLEVEQKKEFIAEEMENILLTLYEIEEKIERGGKN